MDIYDLGRILTAERRSNGQFTSEAVAAMVAFRIAGYPRRTIADAFGTRRVETINSLYNRVAQRKTSKPKKRTGRPHRLSSRQDRYLFQLVRRKPRATWKEICLERDVTLRSWPRSFSASTARRSLRRRHIRRWRAIKRILLTKENAKERLEFCRYWSAPSRIETLLRYLFSDECTIQNKPSKPFEWVFRYAQERFREDLVNPQPHSGPRISLMVWAMIWQRDGEAGSSPLIYCRGDPGAPHGGFNSARYIQVLEEALVPFYEYEVTTQELSLQQLV